MNRLLCVKPRYSDGHASPAARYAQLIVDYAGARVMYTTHPVNSMALSLNINAYRLTTVYQTPLRVPLTHLFAAFYAARAHSMRILLVPCLAFQELSG